eukprot:g80.t1
MALPGLPEALDAERNMFKRNNEPRFYENDVPEINSLVMVKVLRVAETSAYVQCLEYSGHLDMSRRRVSAEDRQTFLAKYQKSKLVDSTMRRLSHVHGIPCEELCAKIAWPLYKKFPHAVDAFKMFINTRDESIFKDMEIPEKIKTDMLSIIEQKLTPQAMKLKAQIEVKCYEIEGIDAVKEALLAGLEPTEQQESNMGKISIRVVAPPHYDVVTQSVGKEAGIQAIDDALERIKATIEKKGGVFTLKSKPEVQEGGEDEIVERDVASDQDDDEEDSEEEQDDTMGNVDISAFDKKDAA